MGKIKDITGEKFGRLTVVGLHALKNHRTYWKCKCECGDSTIVYKDSLISGKTRSCNCLQRESAKSLKYEHGMSNTRFHNIWHGIVLRCNYKNVNTYRYYGAKGIKLCKEWHVFVNFRNDMYRKYVHHVNKYGEKNTTIDRIDNKNGYNHNNCRWATIEEQANNTSRNKYIIYNNQKLTISQWSRKLNICRKIISYRIYKTGMSPKDAFTMPIEKRTKKLHK